MRITINPGHHIDLDPGAVGPGGLREVDVNIAVAGKLQQRLTDAGHDTNYVHSNELQEICDLANEFGSDLFISIHCNAASNPEAHGSETFYCAGSANGEHLASLVQSELVALGMTDRGVKNTGLYVTKHTDAVAVLVELAFISNPVEVIILGSDSWQDKFAYAIFRGVQGYVEAI